MNNNNNNVNTKDYPTKGWECPKCGRIISPYQVSCPFCKPSYSNNNDSDKSNSSYPELGFIHAGTYTGVDDIDAPKATFTSPVYDKFETTVVSDHAKNDPSVVTTAHNDEPKEDNWLLKQQQIASHF